MYNIKERTYPKGNSQEQLVVLAREGNTEAYEELFNSVRPLLYKKANEYARTSGRYDVDDIFGFGCEAFVKAVNDFESERGLKFVTMLGTYFFNYYHSRFYEKERRSRKYESIKRLEDTVGFAPSGDEITLLSTLEGSYQDSSDLYVDDIINAFNDILSSVSERDKDIVDLHINKGIGQQAIADKYGISNRTVSKIVNDFRRKLRVQLKKLDLI